MLDEFLRCLVIGFALASIIGPISILCINQTLKYGFGAGFSSSLGASSAEAVYAAVAAFGLSFILNFLLEYQFFLKFFGGLFLLVLGLRIFMSEKINGEKIRVKKRSFWLNYSTVFVLTIANPLTIMLFLSAFSIIGTGANPLFMVLGILVGSILAYLVLIICVIFVKKKANDKILDLMGKSSALIIIFFAVFGIVDAIKML